MAPRSAVRSAVKRILATLSPQLLAELQIRRADRARERLYREAGVFELNHRMLERFGESVLSGPFAGLRLSPQLHSEHLSPFILGSYESELHDWWSMVLQREYRTVVDIGCRFGYYAVGLALKYSAARCIAFDCDSWAREMSMEMARLNEVSNLEVRGFCSALPNLDEAGEDAFILCDCEGGEEGLFSKESIGSVAQAHLLIETHEQFSPGVTERLQERFDRTHRVEIRAREEREPAQYELSFLDERSRTLALNEFRGEQSWLLCRPKE